MIIQKSLLARESRIQILEITPILIINYKIMERFDLQEGVYLMEIKIDPEIVSAETAISKLKTYGCEFSNEADSLFTKIDWKEKDKTSYEIVKITLQQLFGEDRKHTYAEIKEKAKELGFKLVPAALAPEIWMNHSKDESSTVVVMEAIHDINGSSFIFF